MAYQLCWFSMGFTLQVVQLLVEVPTFTEYLDANSQANLQLVTENEVELLEPKPLFGSLCVWHHHSVHWVASMTIWITCDCRWPLPTCTHCRLPVGYWQSTCCTVAVFIQCLGPVSLWNSYSMFWATSYCRCHGESLSVSPEPYK